MAFILVLEESGDFARIVAKYRPKAKIIACSSDQRVVNQLNACRGIVGHKIEAGADQKKIIDDLTGDSDKGKGVVVISDTPKAMDMVKL